jgi:hypothetical protein
MVLLGHARLRRRWVLFSLTMADDGNGRILTVSQVTMRPVARDSILTEPVLKTASQYYPLATDLAPSKCCPSRQAAS